MGFALLIGLVWIGLGMFFIGVGVLWWVSLIARAYEGGADRPEPRGLDRPS